MVDSMRVALLCTAADEFALLLDTCVRAGHTPVVYAAPRSRRPGGATTPESEAAVNAIVRNVPGSVDLVLSSRAANLASALAGYATDLIVCYCFPWRLPPAVLALPRLGAVNLHPSTLPRYRGPIPVHWAIRNGDTTIGLTAHWMDEDFDSGPLIVQRGGIPVDDDETADRLFGRIHAAVPDLLTDALKMISAGSPGHPQEEASASTAGWMEPAFLAVDWSNTARSIHNQVRTFRFATSGTRGPTALVNGELVEILQTRLEPPGRIQVECGDGPIWIIECVSAHHAPDDPIPWIATRASDRPRAGSDP